MAYRLKEIMDDLLLESFDIVQTDYGIDLKNKQWKLLTFDPFGDLYIHTTFFKNKYNDKVYGVYVDNKNTIGFAAIKNFKSPDQFENDNEYVNWLRYAIEMTQQNNVDYPVAIFGYVIYVLSQFILGNNISYFSFSAATENKERLERLYDKLMNSDSFLEKIKSLGYNYEGKQGSNYLFRKAE